MSDMVSQLTDLLIRMSIFVKVSLFLDLEGLRSRVIEVQTGLDQNLSVGCICIHQAFFTLQFASRICQLISVSCQIFAYEDIRIFELCLGSPHFGSGTIATKAHNNGPIISPFSSYAMRPLYILDRKSVV